MGRGIRGIGILLFVVLFFGRVPELQAYGRLQQCDAGLKRLGYSTEPSENALCGPICLVNILSKFLAPQSEADDLSLLGELVSRFLPRFDFRHQGMEAKDIEKVTKPFFQAQGLRVEAYTRSGYRLSDLRRTMRKNEAVLIGVDAWSVENFSFEDPETRAVQYGHWMIVTKLEGNRIHFRDPFSSREDRIAQVERFREGATGRTRFRLRWISDAPEWGQTIALLDQAIFFKAF